jgi:cyclopropane-fatty-acyl-phospholipid synthase
LEASPIVLKTVEVNKLQYLVPTEFYLQVLAPRMRYSSGYWPSPQTTLAESEEEMLKLLCARAGIADGQKILEIGCGWGALTLWIAEQFPKASVTAVSFSYTQRLHIEAEADRRELYNVRVITADLNAFTPPEPGSYDRCLSVENFEQIRNYGELMKRIAGWLKPEGKLFVQLCTHREFSYHLEEEDWVGSHFSPGATIPSQTLLLHCQQNLRLEQAWRLPGTHFARTASAWLRALDRHRKAIRPILEKYYGRAEGAKWEARWRSFFLILAERSGYRRGEEWFISHYLFTKR